MTVLCCCSHNKSNQLDIQLIMFIHLFVQVKKSNECVVINLCMLLYKFNLSCLKENTDVVN